MSTAFVVFADILVFTIACLGQTSQPIRSQHIGLNSINQGPSIDVRGSSQYVAERFISITRLRVPPKVRQLYERAQKAFQKHEYAEAQQRLNQALQYYPAFPEALTLRGYIQLDLGQWKSAEGSLQAAIRSDPRYGLAYFLLGDVYNRERQFDDALDAERQAAALIPDFWPAQYEIARALIGESQYGPALHISDAALSTDRGTLLHVTKAHALICLGQYPEAVAELRTYLQYQPAGEGSQVADYLLDKIQSAVVNERGPALHCQSTR